MLCSILISNFNKSQYIERCLNSLIEQTYKNIEIIFVTIIQQITQLKLRQNLRKLK